MRDRIARASAYIFVACIAVGLSGFAVGCSAAINGHTTLGAAGIIVFLAAGLVGFYAFLVSGFTRRG
jgi:hypothetical protein